MDQSEYTIKEQRKTAVLLEKMRIFQNIYLDSYKTIDETTALKMARKVIKELDKITKEQE